VVGEQPGGVDVGLDEAVEAQHGLPGTGLQLLAQFLLEDVVDGPGLDRIDDDPYRRRGQQAEQRCQHRHGYPAQQVLERGAALFSHAAILL